MMLGDANYHRDGTSDVMTIADYIDRIVEIDEYHISTTRRPTYAYVSYTPVDRLFVTSMMLYVPPTGPIVIFGS